MYFSVQADGMCINRCISITVLCVGSHKFAHRPANKPYSNSVCITATLSAMLSRILRGLMLFQYLLFAIATTPLLFTVRRKSQSPSPVKGPLGAVCKSYQLLTSLYCVCKNKRKYSFTESTLLSGTVLSANRKSTALKIPVIWTVTLRCWENGRTFRRTNCLRSLVSILFGQLAPLDCRQYVLPKRR